MSDEVAVTGREDQPTPAVQLPQEAPNPPMSRWLAILYVVFCFEMGVFLFMLPWLEFWSKNFFVGHYPWVSAVARNYFLRGAISGIGLADVFLAFHEIWRLRRALGLVHPRAVR